MSPMTHDWRLSNRSVTFEFPLFLGCIVFRRQQTPAPMEPVAVGARNLHPGMQIQSVIAILRKNSMLKDACLQPGLQCTVHGTLVREVTKATVTWKVKWQLGQVGVVSWTAGKEGKSHTAHNRCNLCRHQMTYYCKECSNRLALHEPVWATQRVSVHQATHSGCSAGH